MDDGFSSASYNPSFQSIPCIILHDFSFLCSFIISHPLYSSYFIFFAPYLIKLISLVSPLFIFTVLLSLLVTTTTALCPKLPQLELEILETVIKELQSNLDNVGGDEEFNFEDFEVYKIVFDGALSISFCTEELSQKEKKVENSVPGDRTNDELEKLGLKKIPESSVDGGRRNDVTIGDSDVEKLEDEKGVEKLFEELDRFEEFTTVIETSTDSDKVVGELQKTEPSPVKKSSSGSEVKSMARNLSGNNNIFSESSGRSSSWRSNSSSTLGSYGSLREEKEWRRTLACKLFEERHNSRGGEESMDSLWEAYENDSSKNKTETLNNTVNNNKKMMLMNNSNDVGIKSFEEEDDEDEDEPEMSNGHLCCLQALKLSTGKMNLGMGKPNLVKITKAVKGFGWLHHVKKKHGKKSSSSFLD